MTKGARAAVNCTRAMKRLRHARSLAAREARSAASVPGDIDVVARWRDGSAELLVRDHGDGIPLADRERVLERFVRLDASRHLPGSGLGLNFVAAVAKHHGAQLELSDAKPGLEVAFYFEHGSCAG